MRARLLPALALGAALATAGCQNPDGTTDWGSTLALGAGVGLAAGALAAAANDQGDRRVHRQPQRHRDGHGYRAPSHAPFHAQVYGHPGYGHGRGQPRGYSGYAPGGYGYAQRHPGWRGW